MSSAAATASLLKPVFLAETFLTSSTPPTTLSFAFLPSKRFVIPTLTSAKLLKSASRLRFVPFVATQTSDWTQEKKDGDAVEDIVGDGVEDEVSGEVKEEGGFSDPPEEAKLFVGNLPFEFDSEALANLRKCPILGPDAFREPQRGRDPLSPRAPAPNLHF